MEQYVEIHAIVAQLVGMQIHLVGLAVWCVSKSVVVKDTDDD